MNGLGWSGVEWSGVWSGVEWSMEWSMEWSGVEKTRTDGKDVDVLLAQLLGWGGD